jgi:hypothetical protein
MPIPIKTVLIWLISIAWLFGCAGQATLKRVEVQDSNMSQEDIVQNWTNYHVFFIEVYGGSGNTALLFDPRDDDKKLIANRWSPVEDEAALSSILQMMERRNYNHFFEILGRDSQVFGYLLAARAHIAARQKDDNTMEVYPFRQQNAGP